MELHQILIRPKEHTVIILYTDPVGNRSSLSFDSAGNATVDALVSECQQKLPPDNANPNKPEIEQEIATLEDRLTKLRTAIGQP